MATKIYPEKQIEGYTYFDTFEYQNQTYFLNTSVVLKHKYGIKDPPVMKVVQAGITDYGAPFWTYAIWKENGKFIRMTDYRSPDEEVECIVKPSHSPPTIVKQEYYSDFEVPRVITAWFVYVIIMLVSLMFRAFIVFWIFETCVFYKWRKENLKKPLPHDYG